MRYSASVQIIYVADQDVPDYISDLLSSSVSGNLKLRPSALSVQYVSRNIVSISGILEGDHLVSPLMAVTLLDEAVMRTLTTAGLFEEFDVSRRSLDAGPVELVDREPGLAKKLRRALTEAIRSIRK